jgi:hypothetical protein
MSNNYLNLSCNNQFRIDIKEGINCTFDILLNYKVKLMFTDGNSVILPNYKKNQSLFISFYFIYLIYNLI